MNATKKICLESQLVQDGFHVGPPPGLPDEDHAIDVETTRRRVCPGCRRRGMMFAAFHRGNEYVGVARCGKCGTTEEV